MAFAAIIVAILLIGGIAGGGSNSSTATQASAPPAAQPASSISCGPGTHLSGQVCVAATPKTRTVVHYRTRTVTMTVTAPAPAPSSATSTATPAPTQSAEGVGSYSHADDATFCSANQCIGSFETEPGYIVQCTDGTYSHSGGISGSCSRHGGNG